MFEQASLLWFHIYLHFSVSTLKLLVNLCLDEIPNLSKFVLGFAEGVLSICSIFHTDVVNRTLGLIISIAPSASLRRMVLW